MKKSNTTCGRGTPGSRSNGLEISLPHNKDQEFLKKLHEKPAAPMPGKYLLNGTITIHVAAHVSVSKARKAKTAKSRTPANKSRKHARDINPMQKRDKERPGKYLLKGTKFVRIPSTPGKDFWDVALAPESPLDQPPLKDPAGYVQPPTGAW